MQSWNLKKFVDQYGHQAASDVWGVTHQAVYGAISKCRDIQIILVDGEYQVRESKILNRVKADEVQL